MKIVLSSTGPDLDARTTGTFGRCAWFLLIDTRTGDLSPVRNPGAEAAGGAGVQAAQLVVDHGPDAVLTGRVGPHAMEVLAAAGIRILRLEDEDARRAIDRLEGGELEEITVASAPRGRHGGGGGRGMGEGRGRGR